MKSNIVQILKPYADFSHLALSERDSHLRFENVDCVVVGLVAPLLKRL